MRQAYSDRIVQLPRREYSTTSISSRKKLIEEAYMVLLDTEERKAYDQLYLAHVYTPNKTADQVPQQTLTDNNSKDQDAQSLSIEITP